MNTEHVWQVLEAAKASPLIHEQVIERLKEDLQCQLTYLTNREHLDWQTTYEVALIGDREAIAWPIILLPEREAHQ